MKAQKAKIKKMKLQKANFGKGKIAKLKGEMAILGQILARWLFWKVQKVKMKVNEDPKCQNEEK